MALAAAAAVLLVAATPLSISAFRDRYGPIVAAESGFPATPVGDAYWQ